MTSDTNNHIPEHGKPVSQDLFRKIVDALMDDDLAPELRAQMLRYLFAEGNEQRLDEAFLRYADKVERHTGKLEGEALAAYNRLAERLGLRLVSEEDAAANRVAEPLRRPRRVPLFWRVAAVLVPMAVIAGVWLMMNRSPYDREVTIASAEHIQQVQLPDSTHISVEAGGRAVYRETKLSREVELSGEAFFDVKHDEAKPFNINAGALRMTVLGTEFFVSTDARTVSLFDGKVRVEAGSVDETLSWGYRLTLDAAGEEATISVIPAAEMIARGYKPRLKFNRVTFEELFMAMGVYYEVEITAPGLDLQSGEFIVDFDGNTLEEALELLVQMNKPPMSYLVEGDNVVITK